MAKKYPFFYDFKTGAVGSYVDQTTEGYPKPGCFHVKFIPLNDIFGRVKILPNVSMITPTFHSKYSETAGVQQEGYVFANVGVETNESIVGQIKEFQILNIDTLHKTVTQAQIESAVKDAMIKKSTEGVKGALSEMNENQKLISGAKRTGRFPQEGE